MITRMSDQEWGVLAAHVRDLAYGQGERAARSFVQLTEAPQEVARSLTDRWDDLPDAFVARIIPAPPALRSPRQFRAMVNGVRRRHAPDVPGVSGMSGFDRETMRDVVLDGLFDGFRACLERISGEAVEA